MFDASNKSPRSGGFLSAGKGRKLPQLEKLEDRAVPAVIGGSVYQDLNFNGLLDTGEPGIGNTTVSLTDASSNVIATTTTNSGGQYQFTQRNVNTNVPAMSSYQVNFDLAPTDAARSGALTQFDPTLGTLTSVELIAQGTTSTHAVVENMNAQSASVSEEINADIRYNVGGTTLEAKPTTKQTATAQAFDGQADLKGASSHDFGNIALTGTFATTTLSSASDLAAFIGNGTVDVAQQTTATACSCGPGNLISMVSTKTAGSVKVVYHYTPSNVIGPGQYKVVETQPPGFADGFDTPDNITPITNSNHTDTISVTINTTTDQSSNNNFGETLAHTPQPPPITDPPPVSPPTNNFSKDLFIFYDM